METLYEIKWNLWEDFHKVIVRPIKVIRRGCLPDCCGVTIDYIDVDGMQFTSNPENYFETEKEAWGEIKRAYEHEITRHKTEMELLQNRIKMLEEGLQTAIKNLEL
jgi:hypothetical protein